MTRKTLARVLACVSLLAVPAGAYAALGPEATYLTRFGGSWSGDGAVRLAPGTPLVSVSCDLTGAPDGTELHLSGRCGGGLIGSNITAHLVYEPKSGAYRGSWAAGSSRASLAGARKGQRISLAVAAPDEPARQLTLTLQGAQLHLSMTRNDDNAEVLRLALSRG